MRHEVPFLSQYEDIRDPMWQWRGCGIFGLKMVLDYWHQRDAVCRTAPIEELLEVGKRLGAYREGIGWMHRGLVEIAKQYGYEGFNADHAPQGLTPKSIEDSWQVLLGELSEGPVLASVYGGLDPQRGGGHIVVVTGFQDGLVALNDPKEHNALEGKKLLVLLRFLNAFKRRFIVIRPHLRLREN